MSSQTQPSLANTTANNIATIGIVSIVIGPILNFLQFTVVAYGILHVTDNISNVICCIYS
jgi:hypothetical protein